MALAAVLRTFTRFRKLAVVTMPGHAILAVEMPAQPGDATIRQGGRLYVALEPAGPVLAPIGRVGSYSTKYMAASRARSRFGRSSRRQARLAAPGPARRSGGEASSWTACRCEERVMTVNAKARALREKLAKGELIVAPGIYDGISARIADRMGFRRCT